MGSLDARRGGGWPTDPMATAIIGERWKCVRLWDNRDAGCGLAPRPPRNTAMTSDPGLEDAVHNDHSDGVPAWLPDRVLLDAIAAAVVATDTEGTIFYFNRAAEQMYGYRREPT